MTKVVEFNAGPPLVMLTVLFVGLKLTGLITWPWVWVLSPVWLGFLLTLAFGVGFFLWYDRRRSVR